MKRTFAILLAALLLAGCASQTPGAQSTRPVADPTPAKAKEASKSQPYDSIAMLTEAVGWATSPNGVFRTVDGANSWTDVSPPGYVPTDPFRIPRSFFLDAQNGWVVGAGSVGAGGGASTPVFHTHDGGKTWATAALASHDLGELFFADVKHGWAVSHDNGATGRVFVSVYRTADGGATWSKVAASAPAGAPLDNFPATYGVTGIVAQDESTSWATGYLRDVDIPWLYMTKDGGATWQEANLSLPKGLIDGSPATQPPMFFGKNKGILPVVSRRSPSEACAVFYRTDDGGASWRSSKPLPCDADPVVYDFVDANHGFATDGKKVYATADAGQTWDTMTPNVSLFGVRKIDFVSGQTGWALTKDTVFKTTDGGRTWSPSVVNVDAKATH